jgi:hypothetical protein
VIASPQAAQAVFSREPLSPELVGEMVPLIAQHFHEIARFKDFKVEPEFLFYKQAEDAGALRIFCARLDSTLIGYSVFTLARHPHFKATIQAHEELLYLGQVWRKGITGDRFIQFCDQQLAADGANVIYHTVTVERDFSALLLRRGYELSDRVYAKRVA